MRRALSALLTAVAAVLVAALGAPSLSGQANTGVLTGVLIDSTDGKPIHYGRADVPIKGLTAFTDSLGRFAIAGLEPGQYRLYVRGLGYRIDSVDVRVGRDTVRLAPFRLRPAIPPF